MKGLDNLAFLSPEPEQEQREITVVHIESIFPSPFQHNPPARVPQDERFAVHGQHELLPIRRNIRARIGGGIRDLRRWIRWSWKPLSGSRGSQATERELAGEYGISSAI